jgi:hypothetical protein
MPAARPGFDVKLPFRIATANVAGGLRPRRAASGAGGTRAKLFCSGGSDCAVCDCDHSDARCAGVTNQSQEDDAMTNSRTYEGWWDLSRLDERNEQPLHAAIVAVVVVWATALLLALV